LGAHGAGEWGGGVHGAAAREEEEAILGWHGEGGKEVVWASWAKRPNMLAGGWAEFWGKILFGIKIVFSIYQGFVYLYKEI
jgi:hypothetical protein